MVGIVLFEDGTTWNNKRTNKGRSLLKFAEDYIVIDLETSGLDPFFDDIIEIGAIQFAAGFEVARFQSLVRPDSLISDLIQNLTGITNDMLSNAPAIQDVLPQFLTFIGDATLVGHNAHFDINFLYDKSSLLHLPPPTNDFIDTLRISRKLNKELNSHSLPSLAKHLGVDSVPGHRAISDCLACNGCYLAMRDHAKHNGISLHPMRRNYSTLSHSIVPETTDFDEESQLFEHVFAFTGALDSMTREYAMQLVANAGGICEDGVTRRTDYLVLGNNDYCKSIKDGKSGKQKKAEKMQLNGHGIRIISENVFLDMLGDGDWSEETASN